VIEENPLSRALAVSLADHEREMDRISRLAAENRAFENGFAHVMHKELMREIYQFEQTLNPNEEIGAYLSSFGQRIFIQIENVEYANPYFIIFDGINTETEGRVRLIQHTSQINVLFVAVQAKHKDRKPRRIGFLPNGA
jgi:hypothetical protein